jgi:hypothetical protein
MGEGSVGSTQIRIMIGLLITSVWGLHPNPKLETRDSRLETFFYNLLRKRDANPRASRRIRPIMSHSREVGLRWKVTRTLLLRAQRIARASRIKRVTGCKRSLINMADTLTEPVENFHPS